MAHEILDELTCIGIERMLWKLYNFSRAHTINVCALVNVLCLDICRRMHSGCWLLRRFLDSVSWNKSKNGRPAYQFFPSNVDARKKLYRSARTRKWRAKIDRFNIEKSRIEWAKFFFSLSIKWYIDRHRKTSDSWKLYFLWKEINIVTILQLMVIGKFSRNLSFER